MTVKEQIVLNLIQKLCDALKDEGIVYCHWKSTNALDRSAQGENDLDLLVSRVDAQRFTEILLRLGFKYTLGSREKQLPGVQDYYGYDQQTNNFVHVHAHFQLILGHDFSKNYRIPIERQYLESSVPGDLFNIPSPEYELIVFVIRMILKHSTWDVIITRQGILSPPERKELTYLQSRANRSLLYSILKQQIPYIDSVLFDNCLHSLQPGCSIWTRIKLGEQLQSRLKAYTRRSRFSDIYLKLWLRMVRATERRIFRYTPKQRMANGGVIVAIIGGDGAGKTTTVNELYKWLSKDFETIKIHMGKPVWSWTTRSVRGILKIGRTLHLYPFMKAPIQYTDNTESIIFPGYPWLIREICTARDRYLSYIKARYSANNGAIVICDRFPLPCVKFMDGPLGNWMTSNHNANWLIKALIKLEENFYQAISPPELLIVLKVDPEIAVRRKVDEVSDLVRARSTEIWEFDWRDTHAHVFNSNGSKEELISQIKDLIWSQI